MAIRSNGTPRAASFRMRRAISTHSRPSPGAENTTTSSPGGLSTGTPSEKRCRWRRWSEPPASRGAISSGMTCEGTAREKERPRGAVGGPARLARSDLLGDDFQGSGEVFPGERVGGRSNRQHAAAARREGRDEVALERALQGKIGEKEG